MLKLNSIIHMFIWKIIMQTFIQFIHFCSSVCLHSVKTFSRITNKQATQCIVTIILMQDKMKIYHDINFKEEG